MTPYLKLLLSQSQSVIPQTLISDANALVKRLEDKNKAELEALDQKLKAAEETEGETEISEALRAKASYLTKIGEKVAFLVANAHERPSLIFRTLRLMRKL